MRRFLVAGLALAIVPVGIAFGAPNPNWLKVTGGGQVIADPHGGGPGDTVGFNAQQTSGTPISGGSYGYPAKGQLQVIDRAAGGGQDQVRYHGIVTCIRTFVDDNGTPYNSSDDERYVRFGGNRKVGTPGGMPQFTVDAQDNGQGLAATESDMIFFRQRTTAHPCDSSDTDTDLRSSMLARGNVQEH